MKSVGMWGKLLSTSVFYPSVYQIIFFPRICSVHKYPLIYLSSVAKLLKRRITFAICLLEYCHKEHFLALIICSLNRISFLPQCDRPFMPDCGKILFLKLEKSECTDRKALFKNDLLYLRYSIPGLAFQFFSQFCITRYDTRDIISNFSLLHSYTLFVLSIDSIFKTDVFEEKSVDTSFPAVLPCMSVMEWMYYVVDALIVLSARSMAFFLLVPVPFDFPNTDFFSFSLVGGKGRAER